MKKLFYYAGAYKRHMLFSIFLAAVSAILLLIPFTFIYQIFKFTDTVDYTKVGYQSALCIFLGIVFYFVSLWYSHLVGFRIEKNIRKYGVAKMLNAPIRFFDNNDTGAVRKTIDENAALTHTFVAHNLPDIVVTVITPIVIFLLIFSLNIYIGLALLGIFVLSIFLTKKMIGNSDNVAKYMDALDEMTANSIEFSRGFSLIRLFNIPFDSFKNFKKSIADYSSWALKFSFELRNSYVLNMVILESFPLIAIFFLTHGNGALPISNTMTSITIFSVAIAVQLTISLTKILNVGTSYATAIQAISRIENIFRPYEPAEIENDNVNDINNITLRQVSFTYDDRIAALSNINLSIERGSKLALLGTSGSGKTTLVKLISGFYREYQGEIFIGDQELKSLDERQLLQNITYVFQDAKLFNRSIIDNFRLVKPDLTLEELEAALEKTQCTEIIAKLPDGLHTVLGSKGSQLSGGEQQRLSICRAFLKNSPIVILDEVTSAIDATNDKKLQIAIRELLKNKIGIVIAHKLNQITDFDQIVVMQDGELVERGTHETLLEQSGIYKNMIDIFEKTKNWKVRQETIQ